MCQDAFGNLIMVLDQIKQECPGTETAVLQQLEKWCELIIKRFREKLRQSLEGNG